MDVHDGNLFLHDGLYYWYGAAYGDCQEPEGWSGGCYVPTDCGFHTNHNVSLFTSTDLVTWLAAPQPAYEAQRDYPIQNTILLCPKVVYNRLTALFVLWLNNQYGFYGVATSPSPFGPFTTVATDAPGRARSGNGDFSIFVEDEAPYTAYLVYVYTEGIPSSQLNGIRVDRLSPDYLSSLGSEGETSELIAVHNEAPSMFRRNGLYYVSTGPNCCYCQAGGPVTFYVSCSPLGPYYATSTVSLAIPAQQTDVTRYVDGDGNEQYLFRGDRWQQSPDGTKGHDPTYIGGPIHFHEDGTALPLPWQNEVHLSVFVNSSARSDRIDGGGVGCSPPRLSRGHLLDSHVYGFESPTLSNASNPDSVGFILGIPSTPWLWSPPDAGGGFARSGGPFSPVPTAPAGVQFAYIQTVDGAAGSMSATYIDLTAGAPYVLSFAYSVRNSGSEATTDTLTESRTACRIHLLWHGQLLWSSAPDLLIEARWYSVDGIIASSPSSGAAAIHFTADCTEQLGTFAFLLDSVLLRTRSSPSPPVAVAYNNGSVYTISPVRAPTLCWSPTPSAINSSDALLVLQACADSAAVHWQFDSSGWLTNTVSGLHVNVRGSCTAPGVGRLLMQYRNITSMPEVNEVFDYWSPTARLSACGFCIQPSGQAGDSLENSTLQVEACIDRHRSQQWRLTAVPASYFSQSRVTVS